MARCGIVKAAEKDVDDVLATTCVGVGLIDGVKWFPPGAKLWKLLDAVANLGSICIASPGAVAEYYGMAGWYNLFRRLHLSVFDSVCDFCSGLKAKDRNHDAHGEASYGHGAAVANHDADRVRDIARYSCKGCAHVRMGACLGPRHDLGLTIKDFAVVLCVRIDSPRHIKLEEGNALLRYIQWILRSRARFKHRIVVLLDSMIVIGAVSKGRFCSPMLNAIVRKIASLCFAGGLYLHIHHTILAIILREAMLLPGRGGCALTRGELDHLPVVLHVGSCRRTIHSISQSI